MEFMIRKSGRFKQTFTGTPNGEAVLAALLDFCGMYKTGFVEGDAHKTAYNEGKRAVALHIIQMLDLREEEMRTLVRSYRTEMYDQSTPQGF